MKGSNIPTKEDATREWYFSKGWKIINQHLTSLAAKGLKKGYVLQFVSIAECLDKKTLAKIFNEDSSSWKITLENEADGTHVLFSRKSY